MRLELKPREARVPELEPEPPSDGVILIVEDNRTNALILRTMLQKSGYASVVATDGAVAAFGRDVRRLRPNLLIGGVDALDERAWPGATLTMGDVVIHLDSLRTRCPMTTVDPDTLSRDPGVLKDIGRRFGGRLALNAEVLRGGVVKTGDRVTLNGQNVVRTGSPSTARA